MAESFFKTATAPTLQGWQAPGSLDFQAAFLRAGGWALPRTDAFPDTAKLRERLQELKASMREGAKIELAQPITPAGATGRGAGKPGADGQQQRRRPRETKE